MQRQSRTTQNEGLSSVSTNHTNPGLSPWGSSKQIPSNVPSGHDEQRRCVCVCVCVCVRACVCVCVVWGICINNCLASCCTPIRGSIPPGLKGGEVFCYADTIDGNCQPTKNLKMWPSVCVSEPLPSMRTPPVATSPEGSHCTASSR